VRAVPLTKPENLPGDAVSQSEPLLGGGPRRQTRAEAVEEIPQPLLLSRVKGAERGVGGGTYGRGKRGGRRGHRNVKGRQTPGNGGGGVIHGDVNDGEGAGGPGGPALIPGGRSMVVGVGIEQDPVPLQHYILGRVQSRHFMKSLGAAGGHDQRGAPQKQTGS